VLSFTHLARELTARDLRLPAGGAASAAIERGDAMRARSWLFVGALAAAAWACGGGEEATSAAPAASEPSASSAAAPAGEHESEEAEEVAEAGGEAREEADKIFSGRCVTCHGPKGQGDGPGSAALVPKPRNFTDPAWQASVTDDHIMKIIQFGGAAVGKSPTMPGNPDLMSKPEVVQGLVAHIRELSAAQ
jgi:mono/diheme cytochrome c family protein